MNELFKILVESLRRQAFSVTLLVCACVYVVNQMERKEAKYEASIEAMTKTVDECTKSKVDLSVQVAKLETRLSFLEGPGRLKYR